jgi:hypothetical protein
MRIPRFQVMAACFMLTACSSAPIAVAPQFNGVWVTEGGKRWVEIQGHTFVSYGINPSNGHCAPTQVDVVAKDRVEAPVSALGNGPMSLKMDAGSLVITGNFGTQRFLQASRQSICLGPGGKYAPGAPYAKNGRGGG